MFMPEFGVRRADDDHDEHLMWQKSDAYIVVSNLNFPQVNELYIAARQRRSTMRVGSRWLRFRPNSLFPSRS